MCWGDGIKGHQLDERVSAPCWKDFEEVVHRKLAWHDLLARPGVHGDVGIEGPSVQTSSGGEGGKGEGP